MHPPSFWQQNINFPLGTRSPLSLGNEISLPSSSKDGGTWLRPSYSELCIYLATWLVQECAQDPRWANQISSQGLLELLGKRETVLLRFQMLWSKSLELLAAVFVATRKSLRLKSTQRQSNGFLMTSCHVWADSPPLNILVIQASKLPLLSSEFELDFWHTPYEES